MDNADSDGEGRPSRRKRTYTMTKHGTLRCNETGHEYPSAHTPEVGGWSSQEAWRILDVLKPGVIPMDARALLAGMIAGALDKAVEERGSKT